MLFITVYHRILSKSMGYFYEFAMVLENFSKQFYAYYTNPGMLTHPRCVIYRCRTRSLISWVRPWFQYWVPI